MEQKVINCYKKVDAIRVYSVFAAVIILVLLFVLFGFLWGRPFPETIYINGDPVEFGGWLTEKFEVVLLCLIILGIVLNVLQVYLNNKILHGFGAILLEQCDPVLCLKYTTIAIEYAKERLLTEEKLSTVERNVLFYFETLHVSALSYLYQHEKAVFYCEQEWLSKKNRLALNIYKIAKLNQAYHNKNEEAYYLLYNEIYLHARKKDDFKIQKLMFEEHYKEALRLLQHEKTRNLCGQVVHHYKMGVCYNELGLYDKAKKHFKFVCKHGNTLPHKEFALKALEKQQK